MLESYCCRMDHLLIKHYHFFMFVLVLNVENGFFDGSTLLKDFDIE